MLVLKATNYLAIKWWYFSIVCFWEGCFKKVSLSRCLNSSADVQLSDIHLVKIVLGMLLAYLYLCFKQTNQLLVYCWWSESVLDGKIAVTIPKTMLPWYNYRLDGHANYWKRAVNLMRVRRPCVDRIKMG